MSFPARDPASNQLQEYYSKNGDEESAATTNSGTPLANKDSSLTAGPKGVILLEDGEFLDEMSHFDRERIPERVVHAKGSGAFGYFEVTHNITAYTAASVFASVGKKTKIAVRFSQVAGELGSADTVRDPRGFAVKFYTSEGIWDLTGNNTPIFFIRDAILFPSFIHSQKRNPVTGLRDTDMYWDFLSLRPESTHQTMFLFSDRGIPDGYRHMNGYGSNTFSLINAQKELHYCKFHYITNQKIRNISPDKAAEIAGQDPDYARRDLYNHIAQGHCPSWTFYIQVMTVSQADNCGFDPFDVTKVWYHADYPLIEVGKLVLNKNQSNYFAEIEQLAFNPANLVPGIGPSPDRMLQGRLFAYGDTHRYRLGVNHLQLPVNSPLSVQNFSRDGQQTIDNQGGAPNYHPNSFGGPDSSRRANALLPHVPTLGVSGRYDLGDQDNFTQPRVFYKRVLNENERTRLINNIAGHLRNASAKIQDRAAGVFTQVDAEFGRRLRLALQNKPHP